MIFKIPRLYDSHTHFLATGEFAKVLHLGSLKQPADIAQFSFQDSGFLRGDWLIGFGWDDRDWTTPPHKKILDAIFATKPVYLVRADGHRSWLNSSALAALGIQSDDGILIEKEHLQAWDKIPPFTKQQQRQHILAACQIFNKAGFTHVRDMSCTESLWDLLIQTSESSELTLAIEENYTIHSLQDFDKALQFCLQAKKSETRHLRMKGLKVFYDGALGSETAYLSKPYGGKAEGPRGMTLWDLKDLEEAMNRTWAAGLEFSVHTIGDEAAHDVVRSARKISAEGAVGRLNLEHVELLRPETIQMMKPLHVRCHLQPCHWLSDRIWLQEKLGDLYRYVFPWESLRAAQIPISFGCDSPIEPPSFWRNKQALEESVAAKIRKFQGDLIQTHAHPDVNFAHSYTIIEEGLVKELCFDGKRVIGRPDEL